MGSVVAYIVLTSVESGTKSGTKSASIIALIDDVSQLQLNVADLRFGIVP